MEKEEIELVIAKNQIAIDFDALDNVEEEESSVLPQSIVSAQNFDWIKDEVLFVGVKTSHMLGNVNIANIDLCGKSCLEWLMLASSGCESVIINQPEGDIVSTVKNLKTEKKFIAVFYSDTPLVDRAIFYRVMDYFSKAGLNAMALPRGYVFRRDFLFAIENFNSPCLNRFDEKAFTIVDSAKALSEAANYLYNKIRDYHIKNGVVLFGEQTIFIDGDVEIGQGTVIYPNNVIKGQTVIGKSVILDSGNIIEDSIISDDAYISDSFIDKSKIGLGKSLTGENVVNQVI